MRNKFVQVQLRRAEKELILAEAKKQGLSSSSFLRYLGLREVQKNKNLGVAS